MKRGGRAQISMEFLIIVGFAMLMTFPLIIIFYQQSESINIDVVSGQADKIASEIRDAADEVYYLGSPSKKTLIIYLPQEIIGISVSNNNIILDVDSANGDYQIVKSTVGNLSVSIAVFNGIHHISVEAYDSYVLISE